MAFHHSQTDVLLKTQICAQAQKFCDEAMEANFMAGRPYGAWKSMSTLKTHQLVSEQGFRRCTTRGWRDSKHQYTLTQKGKLFIEALLTMRPEAEAARRHSLGLGAFPAPADAAMAPRTAYRVNADRAALTRAGAAAIRRQERATAEHQAEEEDSMLQQAIQDSLRSSNHVYVDLSEVEIEAPVDDEEDNVDVQLSDDEGWAWVASTSGTTIGNYRNRQEAVTIDLTADD